MRSANACASSSTASPRSVSPRGHSITAGRLSHRADVFIRDFLAFSHGEVTSDDAAAPGVEIGRPAETFRRVRISSAFGKAVVLVTDGHLPWPYGRELTGYEVADLAATLAKATAAGATVLVPPYAADHRNAAIVQFPGGYIAEVHAPLPL